MSSTIQLPKHRSLVPNMSSILCDLYFKKIMVLLIISHLKTIISDIPDIVDILEYLDRYCRAS